jgi:NAD(P)-dependent dehydrogenase (short-subunit alcohol dehydrogenase family)
MQSNQTPMPSAFGSRTTAREALAGKDLTGKVAIVTGGYSGLNLEATRILAEAGATVIVPARTLDKARSALAGIPRVEIGAMDLLDPASIDAFAAGFLASGRPLHMLINGAGVMATPLMRDARGHEAQFSANHLGHYQLTARLAPALLQAKGARVVSVSSGAHRFSGVDFDDPDFERRDYDKWKAYGQSKTANALFALALDKQGEARGIRAFSVHPGAILTDLARHLDENDLRALGVHVENGRPVIPEGEVEAIGGRFKTVPQGAATIVWCAASDQLNGMGGVYCEDMNIAVAGTSTGAPAPGVASWAMDPDLAGRLMVLSERLTGVTLSF